MAADQPALAPPTRDLSGFPAVDLDKGQRVARSHAVTNTAWWFASTPASGGGRFDLGSPCGTCYIADNVEVAVRERLRETIVASGVVSPLLAERFAVSVFTMPRAWRCAHIGLAKAARFGVTRELAALAPSQYPLSRQWASAFAATGFEGIRYGARFTPGQANAWALFGRAGGDEAPQPMVDEVIPGPEACRQVGLRVTPIPRFASLTVSRTS